MTQESLIDVPSLRLNGYRPLSPLRTPIKTCSVQEPTKPNWGTLNDSLVQNIFSFLESNKDILSGALVCKGWYLGAIPALYYSPKFASAEQFTQFVKCCAESTSNSTEFITKLVIPAEIASCLTLGDLSHCVEMCPSLSTFEIGQCAAVSNILLESLALTCPKLSVLRVTECPLTDALVEDLVKHCPLLQEVNFAKTDVTLQSLVTIIKGCPNLAIANFSHCSRSRASFQLPSLGSDLKKLHTLLLDATDVEDETLNAILTCCRNLRSLAISRSPLLTDASLRRLADTQQSLRMLDLSYNQKFTDDGLRALVASVSVVSSLKFVNLSGCPKISPEVIALLAERSLNVRFICLEDMPQVQQSFIQRFNRNFGHSPWGLNYAALCRLRSYKPPYQSQAPIAAQPEGSAYGWSPHADGHSHWYQEPSHRGSKDHKLRHVHSLSSLPRVRPGNISSRGGLRQPDATLYAGSQTYNRGESPELVLQNAASHGYSNGDSIRRREFDERTTHSGMSPYINSEYCRDRDNAVRYDEHEFERGGPTEVPFCGTSSRQFYDFNAYKHSNNGALGTFSSRAFEQSPFRERPLQKRMSMMSLQSDDNQTSNFRGAHSSAPQGYKRIFEVEVVADYQALLENQHAYSRVPFAGRVYNSDNRGRCLVQVSITLLNGHVETLYLHEFDDTVRLATDFANSLRIPSIILPLSKQLAFHKKRNLIQTVSFSNQNK